ncbi:MAG: DUF2334 domain-containing protein [Nitrosopumilus sp.]|nr:DUF2334 domain-containing protein [Nitrosopumilus sp.]
MQKPLFYPISVLVIFFLLIIPFGSSYSEELQSLQIEVKYTNGDRINPYQTNYVIYKDYDKDPYFENKLEKNPDLVFLPKDHRYKIEVYVNDMFSEVGYVNLGDESQKLDIHIPLPGGLKFNVFFEDGESPINNATVVIKSHTGKEQRLGNTNEQGDTMRYWLQSTSNQDDYYLAEVYFDEFLLTSMSNIKIHQGVAQDQKIIVPIPEVVQDLISFRLYDDESQSILKKNGDFSVLLEGQKHPFLRESKINNNGDAYFSSIPSGIYSASVLRDGIKDSLWEKTTLAIIGNQNEFELFQLNEKNQNSESVLSPKSEPVVSLISEPVSKPVIYQPSINEYHLTCYCVSFRLDDVQDYWLNDVQLELIELFSKNNIPLTIGVIIDSFGNDSKIVEVVKTQIKNNNLEIANHGLNSTPFTVYDKQKQNDMLKKSSDKIFEKLNVSTTIFIPPGNRFNEDTKQALLENGYTHLSASMFSDKPPFSLQGASLYRFPEITSTGEYVSSQNRFLGVSAEKTISQTIEGIEMYGFAVISLHPQEFSIYQGGEYLNDLNSDQFAKLQTVIEEIKKRNIDFVYLGEINNKVSKVNISEASKISSASYTMPIWIKNNAGWWRDGHIDDDSFVQGIQFLIKKEIMQLPPTTQGSGGTEIPTWVKSNAGWWAEGRISDDDFIYGVNYLVTLGIIVIDF